MNLQKWIKNILPVLFNNKPERNSSNQVNSCESQNIHVTDQAVDAQIRPTLSKDEQFTKVVNYKGFDFVLDDFNNISVRRLPKVINEAEEWKRYVTSCLPPSTYLRWRETSFV
ncbi:hypothetical protein AVEN_234488-1 [Araneus ventricosus]|uniref:Uncharacterized protein n=1 Tax=Araneus ventricosus TaxID=182803 RepID=A0A4Y2A8X7_ARAVE|nr:hypothetical protein AVEN_234488-1 [Araneus ventricosus]